MNRGLLLLLLCAGVMAAQTFEPAVIDPAPPKNPWIKVAADIDGDGRPDVVIGGSKGPLVWYRNPDWMKTVIAEGGYNSVDGEAADIDGDGDLDLVIGGLLWYENPRPARGPWPAHRIADHVSHDVEVADLNRDGKPDVVVRGQTGFNHNLGHRILIFLQKSPREWTGSELRCPEGEGLKIADLDRDGDPDIIVGGRWYENRGAWVEHVFTTRWTFGDAKVETGDLNGDGRLDIVLAPAEYKGDFYRMAWYEAPADPKAGEWAEHIIETRIEAVVHALQVADLNRDGAADIAVARMHQGAPPQEVAVYFNRESGRKWSKQVLSTRGSHNILAVDLDGDGAPDLLGSNHGGEYQAVEWWRTSAVPRITLTDDVEYEGQASYRIVTENATYHYHKQGAGFAGMQDRDGREWIGFHPYGGSDGKYRGIPNLVHPEGYFHPGFTGCASRILHSGPDRVSIHSESLDGKWALRWDIFPRSARMTVLKADRPYWFLYEGSLAGKLEPDQQYMALSDGRRLSVSERWDGDMAAPEWIYFGDNRSSRVLYLVHHDDDPHPDSYWPMQGQMTVFGFGRQGLNKYLTAAPNRFTIGFAEDGAGAVEAINSAQREFSGR